MRQHIHTFGIFLSFSMILASYAEAQQQKTGYVDTSFIISKVPEYQGIRQKLQALSREWRSELDEMQREIDRMKEDFNAKEILYTEEMRKQRKQEIQNKIQLRKEYMNQKFGPEGDYFQRQKELLEPVQRKVLEAITTIAERGGYDFIFDRAQDRTLLYAGAEWDLTDEVLFELGIEPDDTSN